jgi:hypothetical protein
MDFTHFLYDPHPTTPVGPGIMNVVTNTIHSWPTVSTAAGTFTHDVVSEADFRDNFDWCSDGYYIYIIWASTVHPIHAGQKEVWVTVVPIGSGTPVSGFPMLVDDGTNHDGEYPTITCDPRNNRIGTPSPAFDVAYIQQSVNKINYGIWSGAAWITPPTALAQTFWDPTISTGSAKPWVNPYHVRIIRNSIYGGTSSLSIYAIVNRNFLAYGTAGTQLIYYDAAHLTGTADYVAGAMMAPPSPISTTPNPLVHDAPIVAFADPYDNQANWHETDEFHCLYQYDLGSSSSPRYPLCIVRGADVTAAYPNLYSTYSPDPSLEDTRLVLNQSGGTLQNDPTNNWYVGAVNQMGIHVHWIAPNSSMQPTHFYARDTGRTLDEWIDENTLVTDICTVSDGSSTGTNHGGQKGATISQGVELSVWTDPNYGSNPTDLTGDWGLYQPRDITIIDSHVGTLDFINDGTQLLVGSQTQQVITPAKLTDMPYFYFQFFGLREGVVVNGTWDYYGLIKEHTIGALETPFLNYMAYPDNDSHRGNGSHISIFSYEDQSNTVHPAQLIVHGGADFSTFPLTYFFATQSNTLSMPGNILANYEGNIYPLIPFGGPENQGAIGHLSLGGITTLTNSSLSSWPINTNYGGCVQGSAPVNTLQTIMTVGWLQDRELILDGPTPIPDTFYASNFNFLNNLATGTSEIQFGIPTEVITPYLLGIGVDLSQWAITINGALANAIEFHDIDPYFALNFENISFTNLRGNTILVESDQWPYYEGNYGPINIDENTFGEFASNVGLPAGLYGPTSVYGIFLNNFAPYYNTPTLGVGSPITVERNMFEYSGNYRYTSDPVDNPTIDMNGLEADERPAAIALENTDANVLGNIITDNGYVIGILASSLLPIGEVGSSSFYPTTYSLFCENSISGLSSGISTSVTNWQHYLEFGMETSDFKGYTKLNSIAENDLAYMSYLDDNPRLVFNSFTANNYFGIILCEHSDVDMSGAHSSISGAVDVAGYNTVYGQPPSTWPVGAFTPSLIDISQGSSSLYLSNSEQPWTWQHYGHNNIFISPTTTTTYQPIFQSPAALNGPLFIGSIDDNYFGGFNPAACTEFSGDVSTCEPPCQWSFGSLQNDYGVDYNASTDSIGNGSITTPFNYSVDLGVVSCDTGLGLYTHRSGDMRTLSILDTSPSRCQMLYNEAYSYSGNQLFQMCFDTSKALIEQCPHYYQVYNAFIWMVGALQNLPGFNGGQPRADFLAWLESVLYLNTTDPEYFCTDVETIAEEVPGNPNDTAAFGGTFRGANRLLSVYEWLIKNTTCDSPYLEDRFMSTRQGQYMQWINDSEAGIHYNYDTTLPPLDSIQQGLQELLEKHFLYATVSGTPPPSILSNATANPNPMNEGTVISFSIAKEAYVKIELFDVLGKQASSYGYESLFEPGNKSVSFSLGGLPSGTYYARIITAYGEVQTVKLVKE